MMTSTTIVFWGYVFSTVAVGVGHRLWKGPPSFEKFVINERSTTWPLLAVTIFATYAGGGLVFGYMELGARIGVGAIFVAMSFLVGILLAAALAPMMRRLGASRGWVEFTDLLADFFGTRVERLAAPVNFVVFFAIMAAQLVAMAKILELVMGWNYTLALALVTLSVAIYTVVAGLIGVYLTDLVQAVLVFAVSALVLGPIVLSNEGLERLRTGLEPEMFTGELAGPALILGAVLFVSPSLLVRSDTWQRVLSAESGAAARKGMLGAAVLIAPMYVIFPLLGMYARATGVGEGAPGADVPFLFFRASFGGEPIWFGIILAALFAVLMSSTDSYIHIGSIIATKHFDIRGSRKKWARYEEVVREGHAASADSDERRELEARLMQSVRRAIAAVGFAGFLAAVLFPRIVDMMIVALSIVMVFLPATVHALFTGAKRATAAWWSIAGGLVVFAAFFLLAVVLGWGRTDQAFVPGVVVSVIAYVLIARKEGSTTR